MLQPICLDIYIYWHVNLKPILKRKEDIYLKESLLMSNAFLKKEGLRIAKLCSIFHYKYIISLCNLLCWSLWRIYPYHKIRSSGKHSTEYHIVAEHPRNKLNQKWFMTWWGHVCWRSAIGHRRGLSREGCAGIQSSCVDLLVMLQELAWLWEVLGGCMCCCVVVNLTVTKINL